MALTRITSSVIKDSTITEGKFDTQYLNATGTPDTGSQPITLENTLNIRVGQGTEYFSASNNKLTLNSTAFDLNALEIGIGGITLTSGDISLSDNNTKVNTPKLSVNNGGVTSPSIYFGNAITTGISRLTTPESLNFSVNAVALLSLTNTGVSTDITLGTKNVKILTDTADTYTQVLGYSSGSITVGGTNNVLRVKSGDDDVINVRSVNGSNQAYTNDENRVGINTDDPQATLDVNGSIRATSYQNLQTTDLPTVPISRGGTGITVSGLPEQLLRVNSAGTELEYFTQNTGDVNNLAAFGVSGDDTVSRVTGLSVDGDGKLVISSGNYTDAVTSENVTQDVGTWRIGQTIKAFGINTKNITQYDYTNSDSSTIYNTWTNSIDSSSQVTSAIGGTGGTVQYTYYARLMNVNTGVISSFHQLKHAGSGSNANIVVNYPLDSFNEQRFNSVVLYRPDAGHALLIYRFHNNINSVVTDAEGGIIASSVHNANLNLIKILGQRDIGSDINLGPIVFKDFGPFDRTTWGETNSDGSINSKYLPLKQFPTTVVPNTVPTARAIGGFIERTVFNIDYSAKTLTLNATENSFYDAINLGLIGTNVDISGGGVQFVHDDTSAIEDVIVDVIDKGLDSLYLTGGTYLVKRLEIPENFSLNGAGKSTIIKKQYFDTSWNKASNGETSRMYAALWFRKGVDGAGNASDTTSQPIKNVTVSNLVIDGNVSNNTRLGNSAAPNSNALVYAAGISNFSMNNVDLKNSVGDGISVEGSNRVSIQNCFISDNSNTYTTFDNPMNATDTIILKVSDTAFINNPGPVDITTTEVVAFNSCIIRNSGTGLRIYGSKSANTENNLILGPDDEWIPTTDIYDSDFNSINLKCYKTVGTGTNGPVLFTYVEENVAKNFTSTTFQSFVYTVTVDINGNETLAPTPLTYINGGVPISVLSVQVYDAVNGGVQVQIPGNANVLASIPYRSVLGTVGINYNYIVYYVNAEEEISIGSPDDYNITGVVGYDELSQEYTIKVTAETVSSFVEGDLVTLQEHNPTSGYSLPPNLEVRTIIFANQAWNVVLFDANFNLYNTTVNSGPITPDPTARGYIKKKRTYTIAKGIIGVE
jgi:hypothetical protein